ncbi:MAG: NAD(P)-dependent oxidoreductase [Schleiferilactobacillus perolens]|uniref:NAD(P)-dependent oxidoreductase n=1 Tax=Schleiferilactobacillus perolens TaxID=100468 RepID=UPI0039EA54EF
MRILDLMGLSGAAVEELTAIGTQIVHRSDLKNDDLTGITAIFGWQRDLAPALATANDLRFIQSYSAGVDYFPLDVLRAKHILLANTSGIHAIPIAESTVGYILAFARGIFASSKKTPTNFWDQQGIRSNMFTLTNKTAVIFGTGHIGQKIAEALAAFGVTVLGISHHGRPVAPFAEVGTDQQSAEFAHRADFIINIMPLTPATKGFFNQSFFAPLTRQPFFINVGRGPSVVTADLVAALKNGKLRGAALDVYEQEPLPANSPLWDLPNVLMTPHVSGNFAEMNDAASEIFTNNVQQFLQDETLAQNEVDLSQGY